MDLDQADPKGLVRESYRIEGITLPECRSILIDWALSLPPDAPMPEAIGVLLARYADAEPDHPMSLVLREGLDMPDHPRRRGGRAARVPSDP
jgi:hypothetical protein